MNIAKQEAVMRQQVAQQQKMRQESGMFPVKLPADLSRLEAQAKAEAAGALTIAGRQVFELREFEGIVNVLKGWIFYTAEPTETMEGEK